MPIKKLQKNLKTKPLNKIKKNLTISPPLPSHYYILTKNLTAVMSDFRHFPIACTTL